MTRTWTIIAILAAIVAAAAIYVQQNGLLPFASGISGTVHDGFGRPLADANVSIAGTDFTARTDSNGRFQLDFAPGNFTVVIEKPGYTREERSLSVTSRSPVPLSAITLWLIPEREGIYFLANDRYVNGSCSISVEEERPYRYGPPSTQFSVSERATDVAETPVTVVIYDSGFDRFNNTEGIPIWTARHADPVIAFERQERSGQRSMEGIDAYEARLVAAGFYAVELELQSGEWVAARPNGEHLSPHSDCALIRVEEPWERACLNGEADARQCALQFLRAEEQTLRRIASEQTLSCRAAAPHALAYNAYLQARWGDFEHANDVMTVALRARPHCEFDRGPFPELAHASLIHHLVDGNLQQAAVLADEIGWIQDDPEGTIPYTLAAFVQAQARSGQIDEALNNVSRMGSGRIVILTLAIIGIEQGERHDIEGARETFARAADRVAAINLSGGRTRQSILASILRARTHLIDTWPLQLDEAERYLAIMRPDGRDEMVLALLAYLAERSDSRGELLDLIMDGIEEPSAQVLAYRAIAKAEMGRENEARNLVHEATALIELVDNPSVSQFLYIIEAQQALNDDRGVRDTILQIRSAVDDVDDLQRRAHLAVILSRVHKDSGHSEAALNTLTTIRRYTVDANVPAEWVRDEALSTISSGFIDIRQFGEAFRTIQLIRSGEARARAFSGFSEPIRLYPTAHWEGETVQ